MTWTLSITNVAGIRSGEATLEPGVNAVRATNWQGKSSFIAALATVLGVASPLTEGADRGHVVLDTGTDTYRVDLRRRADGVVVDGTPLLEEPYDRTRAELYAVLGEDNEVRRRVRNGDNLEEVLTRPLDLENLEERIADRTAERDRVAAELERAEDAADRVAALDGEIADLERRRDRLRERRAELAAETDLDVDADIDGPDDTVAPTETETETDAETETGSRAGPHETDADTSTDDATEPSVREALSEARAERERLVARRDRLERAIDRTEEALAEKRTALAEVEVPAPAADTLETRRERLEAVERDVELLQSLYSANRQVLDEDRVDLVADVSRGLTGDAATCWVCGADQDRETFMHQLDRLRETLAEKRTAAADLRETIEELEERRRAHEQAKRRRADLESEIADLEATLADHRSARASIADRLPDLEARIDRLADRLEATAEAVTEVESELKYVTDRLADLREERSELAAQADRRDGLREERARLEEAITALRERRDRVRRRTREAFDEALAALLAAFDASFESARLTSEFDLVIARDGREAPIDALSEGERELLGFVTALAGREAFDVDDEVPLLLDALGGLADDNLRTLVEYLRPRATYLVFTAYPEHGGFDGHELSPADWEVVSDREPDPVRS